MWDLIVTVPDHLFIWDAASESSTLRYATSPVSMEACNALIGHTRAYKVYPHCFWI